MTEVHDIPGLMQSTGSASPVDARGSNDAAVSVITLLFGGAGRGCGTNPVSSLQVIGRRSMVAWGAAVQAWRDDSQMQPQPTELHVVTQGESHDAGRQADEQETGRALRLVTETGPSSSRMASLAAARARPPRFPRRGVSG